MQRKNEWLHVLGLLFAVALILFGGAALSGSSGDFDGLTVDREGMSSCVGGASVCGQP